MSDDHDHYFTASPASDAQLRGRSVTLAGEQVTVWSAGGVFSPDHIDKGTAILLDNVEELPQTGTFLDLGSGWGPIALTMAAMRPEAAVYGVDVNERAVDLLQRNAQRLGHAQVQALTPDAVPSDTTFDVIWSNPPIRIGKAALHDLLETWVPRIAPGGRAEMVVSKNLGSDSLQKWLAARFPDMVVERTASEKSFRILVVRNPAATS